MSDKNPTYWVRNPDTGLGQEHECGGVKPDNEILTFPF
jgi:hypothetical protein